jgi:hypothetical protein
MDLNDMLYTARRHPDPGGIFLGVTMSEMRSVPDTESETLRCCGPPLSRCTGIRGSVERTGSFQGFVT